MRPTLSVTLASYGPGAGWHEIVEHAVQAEAAGVDRILLTDHVVLGPNTSAYPWGEFPFPRETPWLEPLTTLAAMAARTSRVRFSTKILIAPLRPAALLAKTVATLDALSRGRIELGVATGWQREEYEAQGLDWSARGALLTDTIAACRALWSGEPARFESRTLRLEGVVCAPRPLQARIPVWFAGRLHARNLERICRLGDGWIPEPYSPPETLARGLPILREAWARAGRDAAALGVQGDLDAVRGSDGRPDLRASLAALPRWVEAGATTVNVVLSLFGGRRRAGRFFEELAREWPAAAR